MQDLLRKKILCVKVLCEVPPKSGRYLPASRQPASAWISEVATSRAQEDAWHPLAPP